MHERIYLLMTMSISMVDPVYSGMSDRRDKSKLYVLQRNHCSSAATTDRCVELDGRAVTQPVTPLR